MKVETFEVTETNECGPDIEQEQLMLIESLGLTGQRKLISNGKEGETNLCPYRKMTADEKVVYSVLLSRRVNLEDYCDATIPTRVLQVAAHAKELEIGKLAVWCPENADDPDPVLVAYTGSYLNGGERELWLLARWGEHLVPFDDLVKKAMVILRETKKTILEAMKKRIDIEIEKLAGINTVQGIANIKDNYYAHDVS
jgi:hypothetical protein